MRQWHNVPDYLTIFVHVEKVDGKFFVYDKDGKNLNFLLPCCDTDDWPIEIKNNQEEFTIHYLSSGFHEDASKFGGFDRLGWPADGYNDITLDYVDGIDDDSIAQQFFDLYEDEISSLEVNVDEYGDY